MAWGQCQRTIAATDGIGPSYPLPLAKGESEGGASNTPILFPRWPLPGSVFLSPRRATPLSIFRRQTTGFAKTTALLSAATDSTSCKNPVFCREKILNGVARRGLKQHGAGGGHRRNETGINFCGLPSRRLRIPTLHYFAKPTKNPSLALRASVGTAASGVVPPASGLQSSA